jgi:hypothetical protein
MFLFYIFVSPLFRFGPNFRVQKEDITFGLGDFPTVEKVFCSGVHRAPKSRIDSRVMVSHNSIKVVCYLWKLYGFHRVLRFPVTLTLTATK